MKYKINTFRTNTSIISIIQRFTDIFVMVLALYIVCLFSNESFIYKHWLMILSSLVVFQMLSGMTDSYRSWRGVSFYVEMRLMYQNWSLCLLLTAGIVSFFEFIDVTFSLYLKWYVLVSIGLFFSRYSVRYVIGFLRRIGYNTKNVAILGTLPVGINLATHFIKSPWLGFNLVGVFSDLPLNLPSEISYGGDVKTLVEMARAGVIENVYISLPMKDEAIIQKVVEELTDTTCSVFLIPDVLTFNILQSRTEEINGVPMVSLFDTPMNGLNKILKRTEDIVVSSVIIAFISPVLVIIGCMVKFTSEGPVLFKQTRYGMDGKPISVWKFRSMNVMENSGVITQATMGDKRITSVGKVLRKTSLDELPQFFNVLLGDMSIVGPRPHAVAHNEQYRTLIKGYMLRHKVKPGITGWAQINGWRGETDTLDKMEKRIEFDLEYIRNWSVFLDLKIIFLTVFKGFINKSAY
ncbi:undecaprenyl-phosphate glucose phosphotransferase [Serratia fonticola]|uniref:undecaprenyl-phosphate glucose phosphotransferase n=1 Tax=Serratia fonticola TaxID=47917 RepID=UPI00093E5AA9|nr:undecaprenyl-phosphate glucose phosphotransferase [Serratia fonticola]OKP29587.1 undecaprenyl-phosphate glucose phosphotransferase [Serratia fonticola]